MKKILLLALLLGALTVSGQHTIKTIEGRVSKAKVVLKNKEVKKGILYSANENSIVLIPDARNKDQVLNRKLSLEKIYSKDIESIRLNKVGKGSTAFLITTLTTTALGFLVFENVDGFLAIGIAALAVGLGSILGAIASAPRKFKVNFSESFSFPHQELLNKYAIVKEGNSN